MNKRGFTLMEVMVAFAIFLVVMGLVSVTFMQTFRSFQEGKKISQKEHKQRFCLFWMSKEIASIIGADSTKAQEKEFFFIFAKESSLTESRYVCNLTNQTLEHYTQEPTDYNEATYQTKEICLEDLTECAFSYSDGSTWSGNWGQDKSQLPRMVKITYKFKNKPEAKEFLVNIPISQ